LRNKAILAAAQKSGIAAQLALQQRAEGSARLASAEIENASFDLSAPGFEFSAMLDTAPEFDSPAFYYAVHRIVCGGLQIIASRLLGQRAQERSGEKELHQGIADLKRAQIESRKRNSGWRNEWDC
jgi:hypothetical protein